MTGTIIICSLAGAGAGLGTDFAGMSAAVIISPMLMAFLQVPPYEAIGIALASDVLASAVSAVIYGKNRNLDIKNGLVMMITVLILTVAGSWAGKFVPGTTLGNLNFLASFVFGLKFLIWPETKTAKKMTPKSEKRKFIESVLCGIYIGFVCGFIGAGGGLMMLYALTVILGYELKTAVGTSVFIMTFSALSGAAGHFIIGNYPDLLILSICAVSTLCFARLSSIIANRVSTRTLNRITGSFLTGLGVIALLFRVFTHTLSF